MCLRRLSLYLLGAGLCSATALAGPIEIVGSSVTPDALTQETTFSITFDRTPDLLGVDGDGQPVQTFQYFYDAAAATLVDEGISFGPDVCVIRGPEIRFDHLIPIRDSENPSGEDYPHAEGFGPLRGQAPYQLDGSTVRFTVPWRVLGETDGRFSYHLIALERGLQTAEVTALVIPQPPGLPAGLIALPAALWGAWRWRYRAGRVRRAVCAG